MPIKDILNQAKKLKEKVDISYEEFRKLPSILNSLSLTQATAAFNEFCVQAIKNLLEEEDLYNETDY